jgi:hypothetical protein
LYCTLGIATVAIAAGEVPSDLQRLQQERSQQQLELQLKMQQQQDRAGRPAASGASDLQRHQVELDQQQRQRQLFDEQARATVGVTPDDPVKKLREPANERTGQAAAEQLQHFEWERQIESERARSSSSAPAPGTSERSY